MPYYLRKVPETEISIKESTAPWKTVTTSKKKTDRALYKEFMLGTFFVDIYPLPEAKTKVAGLYKTKRLQTILDRRNDLHKETGEWFDVYDANGKVKINY